MKTNRQKRTIETTATDRAKLTNVADLAFECYHFAQAMRLPNLAGTAKAAQDAITAFLDALEKQQPHTPSLPASLPGQNTLPGLGDAQEGHQDDGKPTKEEMATPEGIAAWQARQDAAKGDHWGRLAAGADVPPVDLPPPYEVARETLNMPMPPGWPAEQARLPEKLDVPTHEEPSDDAIRVAVENRESGEWEAYPIAGSFAVALLIPGAGRVFLDGEGRLDGGDKPQLWVDKSFVEQLAADRNLYENERGIGPHAGADPTCPGPKKGRKAKA